MMNLPGVHALDNNWNADDADDADLRGFFTYEVVLMSQFIAM